MEAFCHATRKRRGDGFRANNPINGHIRGPLKPSRSGTHPVVYRCVKDKKG
jgi:hypothetical protein